MMNIGMIGSGNMGSAIGKLWARQGHQVMFSYSRDPKKLEAIAKSAGANARTGTTAEAARFGEVIMLTVQYAVLEDALNAAGSLDGKVVITCVSGLQPDFQGQTLGLPTELTSSVAEQIAQLAPDRSVGFDLGANSGSHWLISQYWFENLAALVVNAMDESRASYCKHWLYGVVMSLSSVGAIAVEAVATPLPSTGAMSQVTSVSQLADVQPTDWAFQALQSLVERYGCLVGYPNQTYRGYQALTRYEFAAGLNACLDRINELIAAGTTDLATKADLATLQTLQEQFAAELATLRGRVDSLETRTAQLETTQFSTTTKLSGEVIFGVTGIFGREKAETSGSNQSESLDESVIFSDRIRLRLNTSFTGEDLLKIRLQAANTPNLRVATGTSMARLGFDSPTTGNEVEVNQLTYQFPISPSVRVTILASGVLFDVVDTLNPLLGNDATGSPFLFGLRSPIYREELGGVGAGINYDLSAKFNLALVYLATEGSDPSLGLLNGSYSALGQLTWKPSEEINIGLVYSRSYNAIDINAGSENANTPFGDASDSITANSYGFVSTIRISPRFTIGGWTGYVQATAQDLPGDPTANIFYYAVTLAFPDLGKTGNIAGIIFGQPPRVVRNEFGVKDPNSSFNIQAFYRFQVNDFISITPGLLVIMNPEHNRNNDTLYIGVIRTTFTF